MPSQKARTLRKAKKPRKSPKASRVVGGTGFIPTGLSPDVREMVGTVSIIPTHLPRSPFPYRKMHTLRYSEVFTITTAGSVATAAAYTYNLNSLYDPDQTSTGHQPYFYDTLTALYGNYQVLGVDVIVRARPLAGVLNLWAGVQTYIDTNSTDGAAGKTIDSIRERSAAVTKPLTSSDNRENMCVFSGRFKLHQLFGVPEATYKADIGEFAAVVGSNPSRRCYLTAFVNDSNAGASATVLWDIMLEYHAVFFGFIGPSQS